MRQVTRGLVSCGGNLRVAIGLTRRGTCILSSNNIGITGRVL